jgi:hypothetical protein
MTAAAALSKAESAGKATDADIGQFRAAEKKKAEGESSALCKICFDRNFAVVFEPCGHACACGECAAKPPLSHCPICRTAIVARKPIRVA